VLGLLFLLQLAAIPDRLHDFPAASRDRDKSWFRRLIVEKHDLYLGTRRKVEAVVEHYPAQSKSV
jgi:hypothetical protein